MFQGLPLHVQIDTYDDPREGPVLHRGYVQLKVFCDKVSEQNSLCFLRREILFDDRVVSLDQAETLWVEYIVIT